MKQELTKEKIIEDLKSIIELTNQIGANVKTENASISDSQLLIELEYLECLNEEFSKELMYICHVIRNDIWNSQNTSDIYNPMQRINTIYAIFSYIIGESFWNLDTIVEYAIILFRQFEKQGIDLPYYLIQETIDNIQLIRSKESIEQGWKDILSSSDEKKAFIEIFDDTFKNGILKYENYFVKEMSENDYYCRMVKVYSDDAKRFIPNNSAAINRWNPPGKIFLYMSYGEDNVKYNEDLTLCEYVCLLECRTPLETECSFCYFKPNEKGRILDLSYNDVELSQYRQALEDYAMEKVNETAKQILEKCDDNKKDIEKIAREELKKLKLSDEIITVNSTKQILKMICNAIYKKVDENQDEEYRSFHILAEYLISQGITGIIYPCTRTNKIKGKNIVLFNKLDAVPCPETIKHYHYSE